MFYDDPVHIKASLSSKQTQVRPGQLVGAEPSLIIQEHLHIFKLDKQKNKNVESFLYFRSYCCRNTLGEKNDHIPENML